MEMLTKTPPRANGTLRGDSLDTTVARRAVYEAFDSVPVGMIITDEFAHLLHLNRTAEDLVQQSRGLVIRNRALSAGARSDSARLRETIGDVVTKTRQGQGTDARALSPYRSSYAHPLSIVVKPVWCTDGGDPRMRIGPFANLDRRMEAPAALLWRVFDLTPAESVVLERLVHVLTLQAIADASGTSRNTVRNQLHTVFEETGTNRQSELIKLVLSTALWAYSATPNTAWNPKAGEPPRRRRHPERASAHVTAIPNVPRQGPSRPGTPQLWCGSDVPRATRRNRPKSEDP